MKIEDYAKFKEGPTWWSRGPVNGTLVNMPNFYVRMLNGLAVAKYADIELNRSHLDAAIHVLSKFKYVTFLDQDTADRNKTLSSLFCRPTQLPSLSNNPYSEKHGTLSFPVHLSYYKDTFIQENSMDYELYSWAKEYFNITIANIV